MNDKRRRRKEIKKEDKRKATPLFLQQNMCVFLRLAQKVAVDRKIPSSVFGGTPVQIPTRRLAIVTGFSWFSSVPPVQDRFLPNPLKLITH